MTATPKKILIVEDEINLLETEADLLEIAGYEVIKATNGEEGFFKAINELPDLILSDVMMPKMDGFELLEAVRAHPKTTFVPFILLTAKSAASNVRYAMRRGADDYIAKPFDHGDLLASIRYRLEKYAAMGRFMRDIEKNRIRMDLHDTLQQSMLAVKLRAQRLIKRSRQHMDTDLSELEELMQNIDVSMVQLRHLIDGNLADRILENGFCNTLKEIIRNFGMFTSVQIHLDNQWEYEPNPYQSMEILAMISEMLTNVIRHASADHVSILIGIRDYQSIVEVRDDGVGFNYSDKTAGNGLKNIFERADKVGKLTLDSTPGHGTRYLLTINPNKHEDITGRG